MFNAWIIGLLGIWMVIASFTAMSTYANGWNDWIVGIISIVLGFSISRDHMWQRGLAGVVGIWLFISGFIPSLRFGHSLIGNDVIVGILLIIAGFAAMTHHGHPIEAPAQPIAR